MTDIAIKEQVEAMKRTAEQIMQSKEAMMQFLIEAKIIKESDVKPAQTESTKR